MVFFRTLRRPRAAAVALLGVVGLPGFVFSPGGAAEAAECQKWNVVFRLKDAPVPVATYQLRVDYALSGGMFDGAGPEVACESLIEDDLFAANDHELTRSLSIGSASLYGQDAPTDLAFCTFTSHSTDPLPASALPVVLEEAVGVDGNAVPVTIKAVPVASGDPVECPAYCGDGVANAGEQCDDGNLSNDDSCLNDCAPPRCGDGILRNGEECDDGNPFDNDACLSTCVPARCGDGVVRALVEECDDGNSSSTDSCLPSCRSAFCGDGVVETGVEQCDDANFKDNDACRINCMVASCGDGVVRAGVEQCDDGATSNTGACLSSCTLATCGDGFVRAGYETCDDGNQLEGDGCPGGCKPAGCGDGVTDGDEQCDDGNSSNEDSCLNTCVNAACGDSFVRSGVEACDDGNSTNTDDCLDTCVPASCADGYVHEGFERCDDGNDVWNDDCPGDCGILQQCGDPVHDGRVLSGDALRTLRRAVDLDVECPTWTCDVNRNGKVQAIDALSILRAAVGQPILLSCAEPHDLVIRMSTPVALSELVLFVDYDGAAAHIGGAGPGLDCEGLLASALYDFDIEPNPRLGVVVESGFGFAGNRSIARCGLVAPGHVDARDFQPFVVEATSISSNPVEGVLVRAVPY